MVSFLFLFLLGFDPLFSHFWSLLPSSTSRTDISNVLHCVVPTLLFPLPSIVGAGTCWSTSVTWQAGVASNLPLQVVALFFWYWQQLLVFWAKSNVSSLTCDVSLLDTSTVLV
jgi:hypothetical protein